MSERLEEFGRSTEVVLVTFTDRDNLAAYRRRTALGFAVLTDPDRTAYRAFGLGRGSLGRVWGRRALGRYMDLYRRSRREGRAFDLQRPVEDTRQLGGDFVIGPDGTVVYAFRGEGPDDRPPVEELLAAVKGIDRSSKG